MRVLVTGGAGYVGTHLVVELLEAGHELVVLDDLSSGSRAALSEAGRVAGRGCTFVRGCVTDAEVVRHALTGVEAVVHLAALTKVEESLRMPERYTARNVGGMVCLLDEMERLGVRRLVFSSSAAVYGPSGRSQLRESDPVRPASPYAWTKRAGELLLDERARRLGWTAVSLRCFNIVGTHPSGRLAESCRGVGRLVPRALGALRLEVSPLTVFGTDYDTADGTCERDFVHVCDVARTHRVALETPQEPGHRVYNVGTGRSTSVRQLLAICGEVAGRAVPQADGPRREGDIPAAVACCARVSQELGVAPRYSLREMVESEWRGLLPRSRATARR